jgi:GT2 family glycosyltransferase
MYKVDPPRGWTSLIDNIPEDVKVTMVCVTYNRPLELQVLIGCMRVQTWQNFEILVYHDGPSDITREAVMKMGDPRVKYFETEERLGGFGHHMRAMGIKEATGNYIGITNDDNYYAPVYLEAMLSSLITSGADVSYCNMIHSHQQWRPFDTFHQGGRIDAGGWIGRSEVIKSTEWHDLGFCGDGTYINDLVSKGTRFVKIPGYFFVHN